jgi:hypothetical protein
MHHVTFFLTSILFAWFSREAALEFIEAAAAALVTSVMVIAAMAFSGAYSHG